MRRINLTEYRTSDPVDLSVEERRCLTGVLRSQLTIEPAENEDGRFCLTPKSTVGAFKVGGLSVVIQPKLPISRILFLASYALDVFRVRPEDRPRVDGVTDLMQAMARLLVASARRTFARGLHRGYRGREEALTTIRGRVLVAEQIRRRYGIPIPIEVRYDEFTEDITANRLVKAAAVALLQMPIQNTDDRTGLIQVLSRLENVALDEYSPRSVPEVRFDRLNEHYREVVAISRLILEHASLDTSRGQIQMPGFLMDMNTVFEKFVVRALREELGVPKQTLRAQASAKLDTDHRIELKPDIGWKDGDAWTFVGDAKYKRADHGIPNADIYQLLAYTIALDLPGGILVYAHGAEPKTYTVRHCNKRLEVFAFDLSGTRDELLRRVGELASRVRALRELRLKELREKAA